ncbi:MAG: putative manganese-dependent inorganic diphosphatase [bacterium]|nr:putative manganese-dependent inorganic diphosphatase [bacterium]
MENIYVFGHRNPDTDSVCGAIALSYLKRQLGFRTIPAILSNINNETKYALDYFNVNTPMFLNDVKLKIKDVNYRKNYFIDENKSILEAYNKMIEEDISKIPVVSLKNTFVGVLAMKDIAKYLIINKDNNLDTTYDNILKTINGTELLKFNDDIKGKTLVASYKSTTFMDNIKLDNNNILIVGDRHSIIEYAINSKIKLLILTGNSDIKKKHLAIAKKNNVNIIRTNLSTIETAQKINLSNTISSMLTNKNILSIQETETLDNFISISNKTKYSYYPVVNKHNKCLGLLKMADIATKKRKKVILVDHNSYRQSVEGIEEADILEIVDHHNLGSIGTSMPINFRNMTVGSSNTIIYQIYKENNVKIPREIAGLMASGIISDTLLLTSPTTTDLDRTTLDELAKIAEIDYKTYGLEMLKKGASIDGKTKEELIYQDFKTYPFNDSKIGIGQISTTDPELFIKDTNEYQDLLNHIAKNNGYQVLAFFVTDILNNGSYVFYNEASKTILENGFNLKDLKPAQFLKGVVSRKLQIIPAIIEQEKK